MRATAVWVALGAAVSMGCGGTSGSAERGSSEGVAEGVVEGSDEGSADGEARPEGMPEGSVLWWRVSQGLWGSEELVVSGDGTARYVFEPVGGSSDPPASGSVSLSPSDLAAARDALRDANTCALDHERLGVPDEAMTHLTIDMGDDLRCAVEVWDNDWRERAPAVIGFVTDWIRRARE